MSKHSNTDTGRPSGSKPAEGTGIPQTINDEKMPQDERMTEQYTNNDEEIKETIRTGNPNRNPDKNESD